MKINTHTLPVAVLWRSHTWEHHSNYWSIFFTKAINSS